MGIYSKQLIVNITINCLIINRNNMPNFDGTGPQGQGSMTGRGMGYCGGGMGRGLGRGFRGRCNGFGFWGRRNWTERDEKGALDEEEKMLQ